ncbi:MAG: nucleotide sugar dehydrogenase [Candidatus Dormibacteria bacterium]
MNTPEKQKVAIVGGCGHIGLPLGLVLADHGFPVTLFDINSAAVTKVNAGTMPFEENGAQPVLTRCIGGNLHATTDAAAIQDVDIVVIVVGTPVDEHFNPNLAVVPSSVSELLPHLRDGQLVILRSTQFPGTTRLVFELLAQSGKRVGVAFCPERIAEGEAIHELTKLPQIVSAYDTKSMERAKSLFGELTHDLVELEPEEAELAKLFTNSWRYIKFAIANQLYMIASSFGLDYERIRSAITYNYPRAADLARAGFVAGPCLLKDTMQLAAFNNNEFLLGHAAMMVNEGLPLHLVSSIEQAYDLSGMTVGILGMAFKADSDDNRDSLSYKLKKVLQFKAKKVLCHDPFVHNDPSLVGLDTVLSEADLLVIGAPHSAYHDLQTSLPIIDIWGSVRPGSVAALHEGGEIAPGVL